MARKTAKKATSSGPGRDLQAPAASRVEMWPIGRPKPYEHNPRQNDQAVAVVARSIQEFGFRQPIVVDSSGVIIAGHTRLKAAQKLGLSEVPVHVASDLPPAKVRAYRLADNKVAELADWDLPVLGQELRDLQALDFDLDGLGWTGEELGELLGDEYAGGGNTDPDDVPEAPKVAKAKRGEIYQLGDHRLMCGDSTSAEDVSRLMGGVVAEMMFTDPPYGVDYEGGHHELTGQVPRKKLIGDDSTDLYGRFLPVALSVVDGPCYLWFAGTRALPVFQAVEDCGGIISAMIIWHKTNATYAAMNAQYKQRHEPCLYFKPKNSTLRWCGPTTANTIWEFDRDGQNTFHPTQKPVALACNALKNHDAKTVVDFFSGSGSTMIAAEKTGRKCYAMEIAPEYVDVAIQRWENFTGKKAERA